MTVTGYTADTLFQWLVQKYDFLLLDVRNDTEFGRFKVEGPFPIKMQNLPYMEFVEHEAQSLARVPKGDPIRIVCAKEGSAKYVGEILAANGHDDVRYLFGGIRTWGNLLTPVKINPDGEAYELYQFRRPGKASCSYGLVYKNTMMLFDPAKNIETYQAFAMERGLSITKTFETHRQADYISGAYALKQNAGVEIMAPELDFKPATFDYTPVSDNDRYGFEGHGPEVRVMHTPGHTPGSTSYMIDEKYLISGDTFFIYSIGRPDLGGMAEEWSKMLFRTVQEKLLPLADHTVALPGHYMDWSEADENLKFAAPMKKIKSVNAEIYGIETEAAFVDFIKANMRPQPEEYAKIRDINAGLAQADEEQQDILDLGKNECAASAMQQAGQSRPDNVDRIISID